MAVRHTKRRRAEHNDPFDVLPDEMLCYILIDNLDDAERMAAYSVSLRWRSIIRHEYNRRGRRAHSFCRRVSALKVILRRGLAGNIGLIEWLHTVAPLPNSMNCNCRSGTEGAAADSHAMGRACTASQPLRWDQMAVLALDSGSIDIVRWVLDRRGDSYQESDDKDVDALVARARVAECAASRGQVDLVAWLVYGAWPGVPSASLFATILSAAILGRQDNVANWVIKQRHTQDRLIIDSVSVVLCTTTRRADRLINPRWVAKLAVIAEARVIVNVVLRMAATTRTRAFVGEWDWSRKVMRALMDITRGARRHDVAAEIALRGGVDALALRESLGPSAQQCLRTAFRHLDEDAKRIVESRRARPYC